MSGTRLWLRLWPALLAAAVIILVLWLTPAFAAPAAPESKTKRMIVLFDDESAVANAARFAKVLHRFKYLKGFVCEVPEGRLAALQSVPGVRKVEEDGLVYALSPAVGLAPLTGGVAVFPLSLGGGPQPETIFWQVKAEGLNAQAAWNAYGVDGEGVKIAVIDTGVNYNLPEVGTYLGGYSFVPMTDPSDHDPIDNGVMDWPEAEGDHSYSSFLWGAGHGTCVTSNICGKGGVPSQYLSVAGAAYGSGYYALKVLKSYRPGEPDGVYGGSGRVSWIIGALEWCLDAAHKPDVVNMSFGLYDPGSDTEAFRLACDNCYGAGMILVASSGNGSGYPPVGLPTSKYPAAYASVVSAGALTKSQQVATYSNGGVDFIAPGGAGTDQPWDWVVQLGVPNFTWDASGTSAATPHISGMFALMIQHARNIYSGRQNQMHLNNGYYWEAATHSCHDLGFDPLWQGKGKADAKLAIDLIVNRWPINRSVAYSPITGSTLNCSTTITNIRSNSVPTPIGEQIANLNVTTTQAYYGENNEAPLPGTTPNKPVLTGGSLDLPGTLGATQVIDYSDSIDTTNLPNIARTELKFSFNFVSDNRTMTVTDPYAALWDPHFISPTISSVVVSPARVAAGDTVHVTVNASDNGSVASVTANGGALSNTGGNVWDGDITADSGLGSHTVTVVAKDEANLNSTDTSASYRTDPVVGMANKGAAHQIITDASSIFLFSMWGRVSDSDASGCTLDDGSGYPIRVTAPGHTLANGDYATARGTLNNSVPPAELTSSAAHCRKLD
ncbi:MAG: S8 family serine peptidase [Armatimonadota bacterium]|nr:S8 family serine peptidase [Armatimonadota bacterium]